MTSSPAAPDPATRLVALYQDAMTALETDDADRVLARIGEMEPIVAANAKGLAHRPDVIDLHRRLLVRAEQVLLEFARMQKVMHQAHRLMRCYADALEPQPADVDRKA
jgi:hypothetical protein